MSCTRRSGWMAFKEEHRKVTFPISQCQHSISICWQPRRRKVENGYDEVARLSQAARWLTFVRTCAYMCNFFVPVAMAMRKVQRCASNDIIKLVSRVFREAPPQSRRRSKKLTHIGVAKVRAGNDLNYLAELSPLITKRTRSGPVALLSDRETSAFFAPRECCKFSLLDNFNIVSGKYKLCCNYL